MGRVTLVEQTIMQILDEIDHIVAETGYPVIGSILERGGIITRKRLRILEKQGYIHSLRIRKGHTHYIAYYTDNVKPKVLEQQN